MPLIVSANNQFRDFRRQTGELRWFPPLRGREDIDPADGQGEGDVFSSLSPACLTARKAICCSKQRRFYR